MTDKLAHAVLGVPKDADTEDIFREHNKLVEQELLFALETIRIEIIEDFLAQREDKREQPTPMTSYMGMPIVISPLAPLKGLLIMHPEMLHDKLKDIKFAQ